MIEIAGAENQASVSRRIKVIDTTTAQCKRLLEKIESGRYRLQISGNTVSKHAVTCLGISAAIDLVRHWPRIGRPRPMAGMGCRKPSPEVVSALRASIPDADVIADQGER